MPSSKAGGGKKASAGIIYNIVNGTAGDDVITPDPGSDFQTTAGADEVFGLAGMDLIDGGDGDDIIHGGDGADILAGGNGNDTIFGDAGDDFVFGDPGSDIIDGGDGWDTVIYYGELDVDYSVTDITEVQGRGKLRETVVVGYEVAALDGSGDVDRITNVEEIVFISTPPGGDIVTQSDAAVTRFDSQVTIDVLANDYILGGGFGEGLEVSAILDVQIDLDGDGVNDVDLIPDGATLADFETGVVLNDGGSILYYDPVAMTLIWDPNGVYDTAPAPGEPVPTLYFWYEVSDAAGNTAYGDVAVGVTYGAPLGSIGFEYMGETVWSLLGLPIYADGPEGHYEFWVTQLSSAGGGIIEERDVAVTDGNYDYDADGDAEYRVWTDPDGTTHEMNLVHETEQLFNVSTITFTGVDAGEVVTIEYYSIDGNTKLGEDVVTFDDLTPVSNGGVDYYVYTADETGIGQLSIVAAVGDEVFVDDVVLV